VLGVALAPAVGVGLSPPQGEPLAIVTHEPWVLVAAVDDALRPRWCEWSVDTAQLLVANGVRVATAWDVAAVHRLLHGGWRAGPARVWAVLHGLDPDALPDAPVDDLFSAAAGREPSPVPVRDDGHLDPWWVREGWCASATNLAAWAACASAAAALQQRVIGALDPAPLVARAARTARSESTAELLCAELAHDGLPMRRDLAEAIVASFAGPRPASETEAADIRSARDRDVLGLVAGADDIDLCSPGQVRSLLRRAGIEVPDTRAWRLRELRDAHPVVEALLAWRKAERIATTYGYAWLDTHLGADGRLRGAWTGTDGAAGRMTASSGLHNMPADMRAAVVADDGWCFVRADLGQIEPRVLAAVSGDGDLAAATQADDLYAPVAQQLGVERAVAKVAVLGAMYGQSTGRGAQVAHRLERTYPVAMAYLRSADHAAQGGHALRTFGGRLLPMHVGAAPGLAERDARRLAAARGRYGRNAVVQGAAAELFKMWASIVRTRVAAFDASIVLCLHDELLVHVPEHRAPEVAALVDACLHEAAARWAPEPQGRAVRFVADTSVVRCWADAKT
jgi:DNA polymerase-1